MFPCKCTCIHCVSLVLGINPICRILSSSRRRKVLIIICWLTSSCQNYTKKISKYHETVNPSSSTTKQILVHAVPVFGLQMSYSSFFKLWIDQLHLVLFLLNVNTLGAEPPSLIKNFYGLVGWESLFLHYSLFPRARDGHNLTSLTNSSGTMIRISDWTQDDVLGYFEEGEWRVLCQINGKAENGGFREQSAEQSADRGCRV